MNRMAFDWLWQQSTMLYDRGITNDQHMLQMATKMLSEDYSSNMIFAGLIHDLFKPLDMIDHGIIASVVFRRVLPAPTLIFLQYHSVWAQAIRTDNSIGLSPQCKNLGRLDVEAFESTSSPLKLNNFEPYLDQYLD